VSSSHCEQLTARRSTVAEVGDAQVDDVTDNDVNCPPAYVQHTYSTEDIMID
jgi:hypothetical protein